MFNFYTFNLSSFPKTSKLHVVFFVFEKMPKA